MCRVCGEQHAGCGGASESIPVDERMEVAVVSGPLKRYDVTLPSGTVTTMKLDQADAERYGVASGKKETEVPDQPAEPTKTETPVKKRAASNKSRTAANKGADGGDD